MRRARTEMARFIASGRELCAQELKFLEQLPQMQVSVTLPEEDDAEAQSEPDAEPDTTEPAPHLEELKFGQSLKKD
ncbi:MAG: hypothetical protein IJQ25_07100 [Oscillibacter sp.]|nr:hypothetical protein [Oscillibacter sp.]